MPLASRKIPLLVLGITAIVLSGITLRLFNDPEGPNLLVAIAMAVPVYLVSLAPSLFGFPVITFKRLLLAISVQILLFAGLYFLLS